MNRPFPHYGLPSLLLSILLALPAARAQSESRPAEEYRPIAIVGFETAPPIDDRDTWLPVALEEVLTARLRRVPGTAAIPTIRCYQARRELQDADAAAAAEWPRVVRLLGARYRLHGRISGQPTALKIDLRLDDVRGGSSESLKLGPVGLFDALNEITSWTLARLGHARIDTALEKTILAAPCSTPSALEYFAKAIRATREDNARDALYYSEQAVQYDPMYRAAQLHLVQLEMRLKPQTRATAGVRLKRLWDYVRELNDLVDQAEIEHAQGALLMMSRSTDSARLRFESALEIARRQRDPYAEIGAMSSLADAWATAAALTLDAEAGSEDQRKADAKAALAKAVEWQMQTLDLLKSLGDVIAEAPTAIRTAVLYEQLDDKPRALEMYHRTLAASEAAESRRAQATAWMFIGQSLRGQDRAADAIDATRKALDLAEAAALPRVHLALADLYQEKSVNKLDDAARHLELALKGARESKDLVDELRALRALADLHVAQGRPKDAVKLLTDASDIAHALGATRDKEAILKQIEALKAKP